MYKTWMFYHKNKLHPLFMGKGKTRRDAYELMCLIHGITIPYSRDIKSELWK